MDDSIDFCADSKENEQKIFVLGDMKELGQSSENAHRKIGEAVAASGASLVILVGPEMKAAAQVLGNNAVYFEANDDDFYKSAAEKILSFAKPDALILIKGSHSMALEKIIPLITKEEACK